MRTVKEVAELSGTTVRTLHHYDEIGLLRPSERSEAGYRLYSHSDLERALVDEQSERLDALRAALDHAIAAEEGGTRQEETDMFQGFHDEYEDEARERWGGTPEFEESVRRARSYGEAEWRSIREVGDAISAVFAALMEAGADPGGPEANALALRHRAYISKWFYECSPEVHHGLAGLYVSDPRFTKKWDEHASGLAGYVHDAILAA
jgi:DNA-binding transcriptional MerR regulator